MPYREPRLALEERLRALEDERADLDARLADHDALRDRARRVAADIEDLRSLLGPKARLPVLHVATPCNARWQDMQGDGRVRFCRSCEQNVYDLTAMSELEAAALLHQHEGKLCGRIHVRKDGTALADDCPVGVRRRRRTVVAAAALAAMVPAAMTLTAKTGEIRVDLQARRMGPEVERATERIVVDQRQVRLRPLIDLPAPRPTVMGKLAAPRGPAHR